MTDTAFFCVLSHEGILAVRGADASKFLQGQLTCNLNYLDDQHSSLGARCTPKGRMQSSFRIVPEGDGYLLAMDRELVQPQLADLAKFAAFSKSKLYDESAEWVRFGLSGGDGALVSLGLDLPQTADVTVVGHGLIAVRLNDGRSELWTHAKDAGTTQLRLAAQLPEASLDRWQLAQIRAGIGQVVAATRELFIPQMINLQALGGVSFKKGCYTGQEIVARMQYLGKLKRRLHRLAAQNHDVDVPAPGLEVYSPVHGSSVGEVVMAASAEGALELLAVLQEDAATDGRLFLGSPDGPPLTLLQLPYTLDADREIQR
ncbi:folate-binding protein [Pseudomonas sp. Choline-3u-10]|uniref:CAF17-like 4Fe-4S cluster assembly/insertion protein YgfZ n=1 Tax=Pseudomonadaceae TaxID=135621 RepID=UPI000617EF88|nr:MULTISPECIES: folate-binding protein YgfZ [Pseudomonadaceae]MBU0949057.1 folate-binding protein YgfZ [Gammaproteobacteria bacterium]KJJ63171.1 aminomethyltransferase [Pseudomonas sp. 10B238]MBK3796411.1 folate-binding protein [Stutzerimonas stutzeri]MBK3876914.1 folate-binding protein [Stutzerimonas stutzeri]PKG94432.1 folate-binding protein [Pseudomonas sp. Choline-3u-10]